uniref:DNA-directed RNA polymerase subunit n=1 Tax=Anthurium amnicola TaxID=1678845 RepID=A0A1D1YB56_9ARAE
MEFCYGRDFLFCDICGTQLLLRSPKFAECPFCGFRRPAREMEGKETRYTITGEDIRRELKIESFMQAGTVHMREELQRPIANKICPNCGHNELEYYTKQLRSADEGATTFYECRKCKHGFREQ